jgi:hypothetical protein
MAERWHVLCVRVGGDRTHAARPGGAGYAHLRQLDGVGGHIIFRFTVFKQKYYVYTVSG